MREKVSSCYQNDVFSYNLTCDPDIHIVTTLFCSGYMAPEYAMRGYLTDKADVYSFGIVALEILSGRSNTIFRTKDDYFYLLDHVS